MAHFSRQRDGKVRSGERRADGGEINDDRRLRADRRRACCGTDGRASRDRHRKEQSGSGIDLDHEVRANWRLLHHAGRAVLQRDRRGIERRRAKALPIASVPGIEISSRQRARRLRRRSAGRMRTKPWRTSKRLLRPIPSIPVTNEDFPGEYKPRPVKRSGVHHRRRSGFRHHRHLQDSPQNEEHSIGSAPTEDEVMKRQ